MKRTICSIIVWLSIGSTAGIGLCEPSPVGPVAAGKSATDTTSSSVPASPSEKAVDQANKPGAASEYMTEKLSNAVSSEYLIGAEDVLEITVWRNVDLSKIVQVRPDGRISMPIIRDIMAVGKTPSQLAAEMTNKLKEYVQSPVVAVSLKEVNSSNIFMLGEVAKPGKFQLKAYITVLQAISMAGGFTLYASKNKLQIVRVTENTDHIRQEIHIPVRYDDLVSGSGGPGNVVLHPGDTVVVP